MRKTVKKVASKKPMMQKGGVKKPLRKAQTGTSTGTPYQEYMKNPGAVASDTVAVRKPIPGSKTSSGAQAYYRDMLDKPVAKNPKNQGALQKAWDKTYGMDASDRANSSSTKNKYLTPEQDKSMRSKGPMKKGGSVKKMAKGGVTKKPLRKAQTGTSTGTPFQQYMKTPGAVASDTLMKPIPGVETIPMKPVAKNPKNQGALQSAWEKTYGPQWRDERYSMDPNETMDQYKRRMNSPMKKGGATKAKMAKGGSTKMAKGGTAHPGFKSVQAGIAAKQGISKKAAGAILASATRKASPKAKAANPRLKRVKG